MDTPNPQNEQPTPVDTKYVTTEDYVNHKHRGYDNTQKLDVSSPVNLIDASTIFVGAAQNNHFRVILGGNRILGNPVGLVDGQVLLFEIVQDSTGSRTLAFDTKYLFGGTLSSITLTTTPGARDFIKCVYNESKNKLYIVEFDDGYLDQLPVEVLVVGGGGSSGTLNTTYPGGGAGGGYQYNAAFKVNAQAYAVTVGAGGALVGAGQGANGGDSIFSTITAVGGGGGAYGNGNVNGSNGGSGGGAAGNSTTGGTGSQGNRGGNNNTTLAGAGGGGAGAVGADGSGTTGGNGGNGISNSISGSAVTYAGGGAGTASVTAGTGGTGGGGNANAAGIGTAGTDGLGGGGGAGTTGTNPAHGGKGVVIISYITANFGTCTGGTITANGTKTVHTFTSSGTFTTVFL